MVTTLLVTVGGAAVVVAFSVPYLWTGSGARPDTTLLYVVAVIAFGLAWAVNSPLVRAFIGVRHLRFLRLMDYELSGLIDRGGVLLVELRDTADENLISNDLAQRLADWDADVNQTLRGPGLGVYHSLYRVALSQMNNAPVLGKIARDGVVARLNALAGYLAMVTK